MTRFAVVTAAGVGAIYAGRHQIVAVAERAMRPVFRRGSSVRRPALIVNRWSGGGKAVQFGLVAAAEKIGVRVILLERGDDIVELARNAVADGADAIGAAGGDGSLGLVAGVALDSGMPFFCIPVGTRNHFALDLGLDRNNPLQALDALTDGEEILIDVGEANGRPFLNNVSFGIYAEAVHRDEYRANKERTLAAVAGDMLGEAGGTPIRFTGPGGEQADRSVVTLVSNNPYVFTGPPDFGRRRRLDSGVLGIATAAEGVGDTGERGSAVQTWESPSLVIESDEPVRAGLDGEAVTFDPPVRLANRPRSLRVLVPVGTRPGYRTLGEGIAVGLTELVRLIDPEQSAQAGRHE